MHALASVRLTRILTFIIPTLFLAGCFGEGDGQRRILNVPVAPEPELPAGFCDPINFEPVCPAVAFEPFAGGEVDVVGVEDLPPIIRAGNDSISVGRFRKFDPMNGETFAGNILTPANPFEDVVPGSVFTIQVYGTRSVDVAIEPGITGDTSGFAVAVTHGGTGWEELTFDVSAWPGTFPGIKIFFDIGTIGDAGNDPEDCTVFTPCDWTWFFDDITLVTPGGPGPGPDPFTTITFDDPAVTYTLRGFGGAEDSTIVEDPADAGNQVVRVNRADGAETFAGTVVSTGPNESVPVIPLDAMNTQMSMRVWAPAAGLPVRLKIENSGNDTISVETEVVTTVGGDWETLTFDFTNEVAGTAAFDPAATYDKIAIFFNFGTDGATAGAQTYYFDDIDDGPAGGGGPGGGMSSVDFETGSAMFTDFGGAVAAVVPNPDATGINTSMQVGQMQKFAGEVFAGSTVDLGGPVPLADGDSYTMKVRALREVVVTLKLETLGEERTATHSGSGTWEELCFDFTGVATDVTGITIIFDNGTAGDAAGDPDAWTFQFDDIEQVASCPAGGPAPTTVDFEDAGAPYTFSDFGGGVGTVIDNPDATGINTSAKVARMEKNAGEVFGGSTLTLPQAIDFAAGEVFTMKVRSQRVVPVLFKFEGATTDERSLDTAGSGTWEELCFDFTGTMAGPASSAITFIFDNGVNGDAGGDPTNWTFEFDDIEQVASCPGGGGAGGELAANGDFETGDFTGWQEFDNGGTISIVAGNGSASAGRMDASGQAIGVTLKQANLGAGSLTPGQQVTVSFDWQGTDATGGVVDVRLISELSGGGVSQEDIILGGAGFPATWTSITPAVINIGPDVSGGISLQFTAICGGDPACVSVIDIDNVSIVAQ